VLTWVVIVVSVSVEVVTVAVSRDTRETRSVAESALYTVALLIRHILQN